MKLLGDLTHEAGLAMDSALPHVVIDLFSGAGGMSQGFRQAGHEIVGAVEQDISVAATFRYNHPTARLFVARVEELSPSELTALPRWGGSSIKVLIGGPPCQGFSESNRRTRSLNNPRNLLYKEFIKFARILRPDWVVLENVAGLKTLAEGVILENIVEELERMQYRVDCFLLNAAEYGVPQVRRRIFIVANKMEARLHLGSPTHGENGIPFLTVRDAIGDLPVLENGARSGVMPYRSSIDLSPYQAKMRDGNAPRCGVTGNLVTKNAPFVLERYLHIPQGGNWKDIPVELMNNYKDFSRCHTGVYHRLSWGKPSKVIGNFRKNMLIHPEQDRGLSVREAARLQSFPDSYIFLGKLETQQQQVADAVPPLLAEAVAQAIRSASSK